MGLCGMGLMGHRSRRERGIVRYSTESGGEKERYGDCFFFFGGSWDESFLKRVFMSRDSRDYERSSDAFIDGR